MAGSRPRPHFWRIQISWSSFNCVINFSLRPAGVPVPENDRVEPQLIFSGVAGVLRRDTFSAAAVCLGDPAQPGHFCLVWAESTTTTSRDAKKRNPRLTDDGDFVFCFIILFLGLFGFRLICRSRCRCRGC